MKAQLFKAGISLKFSACSLVVRRLSIILNFESPEPNIKAGDEITLKLSSGDSLRFFVDDEMSQFHFTARHIVMNRLDKKVEVSAKPNTAISNIANTELKGVLSGDFQKDYTLNNFGFSGTLWSLSSTIADLIDSDPVLDAQGVNFSAQSAPLAVGKLLTSSRLTGKRKPYILENDFKLLPCTVDGKDASELRYNFRESTVEVTL